MTIDREELRRLCKAATPGPWQLETVKTSIGTCHKIGKFPSRGAHGETSACVYADSIREHDIGHSKVGDELLTNARLIAAARTAVPALLDEIDALERVVGGVVIGIGSTRFMDPPDGGAPSLGEQVERMRLALDAAEAREKSLRELLAIYVHAHKNGNAVPPNIEDKAKTAVAETAP